MNRRTLLLTVLAGAAGSALPSLTRTAAQEATPVPGKAFLNIMWQLDRIASGDSVIVPDEPANYWVQFQDDGELLIRADCNQASASFKVNGSSVGLGEIFSTKVSCGPASISDEFLRDLKYVVSYILTGDVSDQLVLEMMADGGQLIFKPALTGVVWQWVEFEGGDGSIVKSSDPNRYTIEFPGDGTVQVRADCNSGSGPVITDGQSIDFTVATTRTACPSGSQADDFLRYLDDSVSYVIRDGRLALSLAADAGIALFQPVIPIPDTATPTSS